MTFHKNVIKFPLEHFKIVLLICHSSFIYGQIGFETTFSERWIDFVCIDYIFNQNVIKALSIQKITKFSLVFLSLYLLNKKLSQTPKLAAKYFIFSSVNVNSCSNSSSRLSNESRYYKKFQYHKHNIFGK